MIIERHENEASWLEARAHGIGTSELAAALGLDRHVSPTMLWARKTKRVRDTEETERMRWGRRLQPFIAEEYSSTTGRGIESLGDWTMLWSECTACEGQGIVTVYDPLVTYGETCPKCEGSKKGVVFTTLDYVLPAAKLPKLDPRAAFGDGVLEIKAVDRFSHPDDWKEGEDGPLEYQVQVQGQLGVTGLRWGVLCPLIGGNMMRPRELERSETFITRAFRAAEDFWRLVRLEKRPPADASEATARALEAMYSVDDGETITLPGLALSAHELYEEAEALIKRGEAMKRQAENAIKDMLEGHRIGILPDGSRAYSWKHTKRKGYTVGDTEYRRFLQVNVPKPKKGKS